MDISIEKLVFGYFPTKLILKDLSVSLKGEDLIAIVGGSGTGKSTLLRLIAGLIKRNQENTLTGTLKIDGKNPEDFAQKGVTSFMFQEPTLFPNRSVWDNVALPIQIHQKEDYSEVDKLIKLVGLNEFWDYLPSRLSGGMKTRVALARTFVNRPKLLLLDEPFSALDIRWRYSLYRELHKLQEEYQPKIIMVTHDILEALLLSNHILVLGQQGNILQEIVIDKPLPRIFDLDGPKHLQNEYVQIQKLIMEDSHF